MPIIEDYELKYWFQTPEPACRPGYAGFLPGYGPRRLFQFGRTFGRMTHDLMIDHPMAGLRLANVIDSREFLQKKLENEALTWKHEVSSENNKFNRTMVVGYAGYVPRRRFLQGMSYYDECKEATARFEKLKLLNQQ